MRPPASLSALLRPVAGIVASGLAVVAAFPPRAEACGQRVHAEMARRAAEDHLAASGEIVPGIERLFETAGVRVAFYCGAMFPDWGYEGIDPDAAEHTHWHAFQEALFAVVKEKLAAPDPTRWTHEDRRRVAFLLGVVSHGVTDNPWHFSSRERASFLATALARAGADHTRSEIGGDLILHADRERRIELDRDLLYWPLEDVLEALRRSGSGTTLAKLRRGCLRMEATWRAAAIAAPLSAGYFRARHPWLAAHLEDYAFGGIAHGAAATACWARYYVARFRGEYLFQDTPEYGRASRDDSYTYAGCRDSGEAAGARGLELGGGRRVEIAFDVGAIPAGAGVARATLWLHAIGDGPVESEPEMAEAQAPGVEGVFGTAILRGAGAGWVGFDVTVAVRAWVGGAKENRGLVIGAPAAKGVHRFDSSAAFGDGKDGCGGGTRVAFRPILVVVPDH